MKRLTILITMVALFSLGLAAPVLAAAPGNDTYPARELIGSLPFTASLDTSEATADALDAEAAGDCGAPATDASVWYELVPDIDGQVLIDAGASDYAVGIIVVTGSPGSFELQSCGAGALSVSGTTGVALTILVFDYDSVGNGGNLELTVADAPPPPVLDLTVDAKGSIDARTGVATIRGTITCSGGEEFGKNFIEVHLVQTVGRFRIEAGNGLGFDCNGVTQPWSVELIGWNGKLAGGRATVTAFAYACAFDCAADTVERVVTLKR
jgi:hypothetical protein